MKIQQAILMKIQQINYRKLIQPLIIFGLLIYIFLLKSCNNPSKNNDIYQKFKTKEIVGKFDTIKKPKELSSNKKYKYSPKQSKPIITNNPIDSILVEKFEKAPDSTKIKLFVDQTQIRSYKQEFDDKYIKITFFAKTRGELLEISPEYIIKPQNDSIKIKQSVFALYLGGGAYYNNMLNYKIDIGFQNKKGDILFIGYDPFNKVYFAEYNLRIFNIKK